MLHLRRNFVVLVGVFGRALGAQLPDSAVADHRIAAEYRVLRTGEGVRLDARLSDPVWRQADSIVDFRQREPLVGEPASERTVVKIIRDNERIYIGVRAYDLDMTGMRSTQLRRDADLSSDDNVTVLIDSYRDRRAAFLFGTNPNGAMWDAQLTGFGNINENWNGIWDVVTRRDSAGWTAEFAIPLRTLRFNPGHDIIGLNVRRVIRRKNEEDLWQSWGRREGLENLVYSADVSGFRDVSANRTVEVRPYLLGRLVAASYDPAGPRIAAGSSGGKAGVDAKFGVTGTLKADLTLNTDFAQVEADQQVINLTRFPTFLSEKREFFLESSGLFDIGTLQRVQLFYSRRIGLDSSGVPVPILGGARLYGKQGPWSIGLLDARTGGAENANDVAVRVGRDLLDRSALTAMFVARSTPARPSEVGSGVDLDFPLIVRGHNVEPHLWLMGTRTPLAAGTPLAWRISTDYPNDLFDNFVSLYRIDNGFAPTIGFARRTGIWETTGHIDYTPRPRFLGIRQLDLTPIPIWDIIADRTRGDLTSPSRWQTADFEWHLLGGDLQSGDHFEVNVLRDLDAPDTTFPIFRSIVVAPGRYWWTSGNVQYFTSPGRPVSANAILSTGPLYDGRSSTVELGGTFRGGGHMILNGSYSVTSARLSGGRFTATQLTSRIEYAFNTRIVFLGFAQYQNEERRADFNLRFHWIPIIGDDFFAVWNSGFTTDPDAPWRFPAKRALSHPLNGAFVIKAVHRFAH